MTLQTYFKFIILNTVFSIHLYLHAYTDRTEHDETY